MPPPELLVVIPVFNEEVSVKTVIREWFEELDCCVGNFTLLAIDDGSRDSTLAILESLRGELGERMECINRPNRGHGQTCMEGYHIALERGVPFVLQIDSDGQSEPKYFSAFWQQRLAFDVIYGKRRRSDGLMRVLASWVLRRCLKWFAGADCIDANVPYRLMNTNACAGGFRHVPATMFLANVGLAVVLRKSPSIRHGEVPIGFPPRRGGEPSVPFVKFAVKGVELFRQLKESGV